MPPRTGHAGFSDSAFYRAIKIAVALSFFIFLLYNLQPVEGAVANLTYFGRHSLSFPEALGGKSSIEAYSQLINEIIRNFRSISSLEALSEALNLVEECPTLECLAYEPELTQRVTESLRNLSRSNIEPRDIAEQALTAIEVVGLTDSELINLIENPDLRTRLENLASLNRERLYEEIQETMNLARWMYSEGSITSIEYAAALELLKRISSSRALDDLTVILSRDQIDLIRNILTEAFQKSVPYEDIRDPWLLASVGGSGYRSSSIDLIDRIRSDRPLSREYLFPSPHAAFTSGLSTLFGGSSSTTNVALMFLGILIIGFLILVESNSISRNIDRILNRVSKNIYSLKLKRTFRAGAQPNDIVSIYWKAVEVISSRTLIAMKDNETHREYLARIEPRLSLFKDLFRELTEMYERKRFGGYDMGDSIARARILLERIRRVYS